MLAAIAVVMGSAPASADSLRPAFRSPDPDTLVINVVGDVAYPDGWGGIDQIDAKKHELFALVQSVLDTGDLNFANIECPLTDAQAVLEKTYPITCKPERLHYIIDAGFNLLSLANNHSIDAGVAGIMDTIERLAVAHSAERPLWWAGTGASAADAREHVMVSPPGKNARVAFFAVANTSPRSVVGSVHDPTLEERIAAASATAEFVIVSIHYGPEYVHVPSRDTVQRYHRLFDAGADLVVAHHAHVVQGVERYGKGFIFYNLGNFSFGSRTRRHLPTGARLYSMIGRVTVRKGALARVELVPLYANNSARWTLGGLTVEPRHAMPQLLSGIFAQAALDEFEDFARAVPTRSETRLVRVGDRLVVDMGAAATKTASRAVSEAVPDGVPEAVMEAVIESDELAALLHQQRHEYAAVVLAGATPRPATEAEMLVKGRGGTPDAAARDAQRTAAREARMKKREKERHKKRKARERKRKRAGKR